MCVNLKLTQHSTNAVGAVCVLCMVRASVCAWVGLPSLVEKEKPQNTCLFSDEQCKVLAEV